MKILKHVLILVLFVASNSFAQKTIQINRVLNADTIINLEKPISAYSMSVNGSIQFNSIIGAVSIIMIDKSGEKYLVYEGSKLTRNTYSINLNNEAEETYYLYNLNPMSIEIKIKNATLNLTNIVTDTLSNSNKIQNYNTYLNSLFAQKLANVQSYITENQMLWTADDNTFARMTYSQKVKYFGDSLNKLQGFEYYVGGIFELLPRTSAKLQSALVDNFDWRNRHGANNPNSPYWDGDNVEWSGWITTRHEGQACNDCWLFSPVYTTESMVNLYYNQHLDKNLSEQNLLSCIPITDHCLGYLPSVALDYLKNSGVVNENCFPYQGDNYVSCNNICTNPSEKIFINNYGYISPNTEDNIKLALIQNGPLSSGISGWSHAMSLVGYNTVKVGSYLSSHLNPDRTIAGINVPENSPLIGKTYWIFKQSWGSWVGGTPYVYVILDDLSQLIHNYSITTPITSNLLTSNDIRCVDLDGDGYYNWGIGPKPATCPSCPDEEDCDDSKAYLGPYDDQYGCALLCDHFIYSSISLELQQNEILTNVNSYNCDIIIDPSYTLTIKGTVNMVQGSKIIVKQGAKLIIDGGKISSACGGLWKGIEVWGTENKSQLSTDLQYQGQVEIINGGVIENAEVGVYLGKRDAAGNQLSGFGGGLLKAKTAVFRNNKVAVDFQQYFGYLISNPAIQKPNFSYLIYCTFETTALWNFANTYPDAFVKLNAVDGITFSGCTFQNTAPANFAVYNRGKGIVTEDGYFKLQQYCAGLILPCTNLINNTFSNLYYAIDAQKICFDNLLIIKNAVFNSNYRGAYISGILTPIISDNTFSIPDFDPNITTVLPTDNQPYGLYLNASTGYTVENNAFNNATVNKSTKYGAIINGSGTANNRIYRNTFTNLYVGSSAQGNNRGSGTGLVFKCNEYTNCTRDISMSPYSRFFGVASPYQGSTTEPAANLFSHAGTPQSDIYNESWWVNYYHNTPATPVPQWVPVNYSTSVTLFNTGIAYNKTTQCPVTSSGGGGGSTSKGINSSYVVIQGLSAEIATIESQLSNLVDGGNTVVLINTVETSPTWEALYLRNNLLNKSPYLSDTVLATTVQNESAMPPLMLSDVLKANPHAIKSESVKESIENRQNSIPEYLMNEIENSGKSISAKEHLEAKALMLRNRRATDVYSLISEFRADTLNKYAVDSICSLLDFETTCNTLFNKYLLMLQANRISTADEYLSQIGDADLIFLATLVSNIKSNLKQMDSLSVADISQLSQIANNEESCGNFIARNLLLKLHKIKYTEPIYDILQSESKKMAINPQKEAQENLLFKIYPNPAKEWVIVYYKTKTLPFTIEVCDLLGKVIYSKVIEQSEGELMIETASLTSGNYFVKLQAQGATLKTEKLTISNK